MRVIFRPSAVEDLNWFEAHEQRVITDGVRQHLSADAEVESRRRRRLRPNPLGPWELRIGRYRVFYEVDFASTVRVSVVGYKEHNDLFVRGRKVEL